MQNSEYITFPNWAAQKPQQQLCKKPEEAQPMSDLCQAILQVYRQHGCISQLEFGAHIVCRQQVHFVRQEMSSIKCHSVSAGMQSS